MVVPDMITVLRVIEFCRRGIPWRSEICVEVGSV